ncbi:MAG: hypothetical protein WCV92_04370 [Candidatus Buchananbacteria bacterium]
MPFTDIGKLLNKSLARHGIKDQVFEKMAVIKFEEIKEIYFGKDLSDLMRPLYLKWGNLIVACLNEDAAKAIYDKEEVIIGILNNELGNNLVKRLKCLL